MFAQFVMDKRSRLSFSLQTLLTRFLDIRQRLCSKMDEWFWVEGSVNFGTFRNAFKGLAAIQITISLIYCIGKDSKFFKLNKLKIAKKGPTKSSLYSLLSR